MRRRSTTVSMCISISSISRRRPFSNTAPMRRAFLPAWRAMSWKLSWPMEGPWAWASRSWTTSSISPRARMTIRTRTMTSSRGNPPCPWCLSSGRTPGCSPACPCSRGQKKAGISHPYITPDILKKSKTSRRTSMMPWMQSDGQDHHASSCSTRAPSWRSWAILT